MRPYGRHDIPTSRQTGVSLVETVVVLAVLGTIAVVFLNGMVISSRAAFTADQQVTAESLARIQMEWTQNAAYSSEANSYSPAPIPGNADYVNFSANITALPLNTPDDGIQKIIVSISRSGGTIFTLEGYKVNR